MLEKLILAATVTFSAYLSLNVSGVATTTISSAEQLPAIEFQTLEHLHSATVEARKFHKL
ncbi:MAG: hypothetical protein F6K36_21365 [Symploca sp. SIO3C6]|uniref:Uncharacterized protein n=1 Tax=Symploca sp. SIO1C4 TaxID=2607765 RepID=A0A6B3NAQ4_9CYAN|nr:hypothetical protein [Symploca sp. SIO3C6]NER30676.1 hypothetical protein [Symploca sp. SIO1C4]NET04296.1 hypothetical protein [Symploca sp. SIO2B6]